MTSKDNGLQEMTVFAALTVDDVGPLLGLEHQHNDKAKVTFSTPGGNYTVKINTKRLQCFAKNGIACIRCGISGCRSDL